MSDIERLQRFADGVRPTRDAIYAHCAAGGTWVVAAKWPKVLAWGDPPTIGKVVRINAFDNPVACSALIMEAGDDFVRAYALDAEGRLCEPKEDTA